jgi:hypothetical protein
MLAVLTLIGLPDETVDVGMWSLVEIGLSIAAASLATLKPLVSRNHDLSYPSGGRTSNPTRSGAIKGPTGSSRLAPFPRTPEGHHRLENWPPVPAGMVSTLKGSRSSFGKVSGDSEENLRSRDGDIEGRYNSQKTFAMVSTVERLDHD